MSRAIETLMHEHRVIERVLDALERYAIRVRQGEPGDRSVVRDFADFFANFADRCHHGKEEDRLFTAMVAHGFPREQGPVGVMLADHRVGREQVGALREIGAGTGPLSEVERAVLASRALGYAEMLRAHIAKEDQVLYPMALQAIPPAEMERMATDFEDFEATVMGVGEHERFHALADALIARFGAPAPVNASGQAKACCHHSG
jgi:hemerythrin-like domain-containing protein